MNDVQKFSELKEIIKKTFLIQQYHLKKKEMII